MPDCALARLDAVRGCPEKEARGHTEEGGVDSGPAGWLSGGSRVEDKAAAGREGREQLCAEVTHRPSVCLLGQSPQGGLSSFTNSRPVSLGRARRPHRTSVTGGTPDGMGAGTELEACQLTGRHPSLDLGRLSVRHGCLCDRMLPSLPHPGRVPVPVPVPLMAGKQAATPRPHPRPLKEHNQPRSSDPAAGTCRRVGPWGQAAAASGAPWAVEQGVGLPLPLSEENRKSVEQPCGG